MADNSKQQKGRGKAIPALNVAINGLNSAKDTTPVNPVFGSVTNLLTTIRVNSLPSRDETFQAHT